MTWERLIELTAERAQVHPLDAAAVVNALFDTMIDGMETEKLMMLRPDFGYFEMRTVGGDPADAERNVRKAHRTPVFKKSGALKKKLRQSDEAYLDMLQRTGRGDQAERILRKQSGEHSA